MLIHSYSGDGGAMKLTKGVLIYEDGSAATASIHDMAPDPTSGVPIMMPGQPLTADSLTAIMTKIAGTEKKTRSLVPINLLCAEAGRLIWHVPAVRRVIFFKTSDKALNDDLNGKMVLHPALLFVAENKRQLVFALHSDERPDVKTKLYHAPYLNMYDSGAVCAGARPPRGYNASDIPAWERLFFDTNFSHTNRDMRKLTTHPKGHNGLWRELARQRGRGVHKTFPTQWLVPCGKKTVKDLLNGKL